MLQLIDITAGIVLKSINLKVNKDEFVLIVGDNGAGKTTLFNTISGSIKPRKGKILIAGQDVTDASQHARASVIANVFQDPKIGTIGNMTLRENLNIAYKRGTPRTFSVSNARKRDAMYKEKLQILNMNLENRLDDYVKDLSGGQRQALSVIMATLSDAKILLLDEITAALDRQTAETLLRFIEETIIQEKKTCLMITHDTNHIERLGDKVMTLRNGQLTLSGKIHKASVNP
ncbi:MAG: ATP-binding cassette domain-containing protein [Holosporales bacterium]|jgi:putative ABC transport system ATP-binding protein|nr:ATP-binding cassette domain-containing protein [Holosporales bacterium]